MGQPFAAAPRPKRGGRSPLQSLLAGFLALLVATGLTACNRPGQRLDTPVADREYPQAHGSLTEVAPPAVLNELRPTLDRRRPQVKILSPKPNETLAATNVQVRLEVRDLPLFLNPDLGLGPHLHLLLDNQPYQAIYDVSKPIQLTDLSPGTHTLRAFVVRPWHESFKNEGAYAQVSFNVFTPSPENQPAANAPLLTYSRPKGSYGAEPILLDFYLTNAPLHALASSDADASSDWRIRVTVNGESFLLDDWQPVWLEGFRPGSNWVKTELLDDKGRPLETSFNTTVRLMEFQPGGEDTYSKLVRGELSASAAFGMVDPTYQPPSEPEPNPAEDEKDVKKDEVLPAETAPVAIPKAAPSPPPFSLDGDRGRSQVRSTRLKERSSRGLGETTEQPEMMETAEEGAESKAAPAAEPRFVPSPATEQRPSPNEDAAEEPAPPEGKTQDEEDRLRPPEATGQEQGQTLQRQLSRYLQRFRRQPRVEPEPATRPSEALSPAMPSTPSSPLPFEPLPTEVPAEELSPSAEEGLNPSNQPAEPPTENSTPPAVEPARTAEQSAGAEPSLLDQAKDRAGQLVQDLSQQSQARSQRLQHQFTTYLQRFRQPPSSAAQRSSTPIPSAEDSSAPGKDRLIPPDRPAEDGLKQQY